MPTSAQFLKLRGESHDSRSQDNIDATVRPIAMAVGKTPIMGASPPAWIRPELSTLFANVGAPLALAGFHRDCLGYVHSKGSLVSAAGCATGTTIMVFPMGYRPSETLRLPVPVTAGGQWVTVNAAGIVATAFVIAAGGGIDLAFNFLAEQ